MKLLYALSFVLWVPFSVLSWCLLLPSFLLDKIAALIHDETTYRLWVVMHNRRCRKMYPTVFGRN